MKDERLKRIQWSERQDGTATIYGTWGVIEILTGKELGILNFAIIQALKAIGEERRKDEQGNGVQESSSVSAEERGSVESLGGQDHRGGSEEGVPSSEEGKPEPQESEGQLLADEGPFDMSTVCVSEDRPSDQVVVKYVDAPKSRKRKKAE